MGFILDLNKKKMFNFEENYGYENDYSENLSDYSNDKLKQQDFFYLCDNDFSQSKGEFNDKDTLEPTDDNLKNTFLIMPETRWENSESSNTNNSSEEHLFQTKNNSLISEVNEIKNDENENDLLSKNIIKENASFEYKNDLSPHKKKEKIKTKLVITPSNDEIKKTNKHPFISCEYQGSITIDKTYNYKDIIIILKKIKISDEIIKKIKKDVFTKEFKKSFGLFNIQIKRKRTIKRNIKIKRINDNKEKKKNPIKRGRKTLGDPYTKGKRNKYCVDNIIKKIKVLFFSCVIEYVQIFLNNNKKNYDGDIKLLTLDHKQYINKLVKKLDLELLRMPLKDLISLDTSKRYAKISDKDWNKKIIEKILEKEKNNKKINDLLNMSFNKWIDIFTYKKEWKYNNIEFDKLKTFIEDISENNDEEYFSKVISYLFNYKRWFINLKGRNRNKSNENQKSKK